jgi:hypothetical protein
MLHTSKNIYIPGKISLNITDLQGPLFLKSAAAWPALQ